MVIDYKQRRIRHELRMVWLGIVVGLEITVAAWLLGQRFWPHTVWAFLVPLMLSTVGGSVLRDRRRRILGARPDPLVAVVAAVLVLATLATFVHALTG